MQVAKIVSNPITNYSVDSIGLEVVSYRNKLPSQARIIDVTKEYVKLMFLQNGKQGFTKSIARSTLELQPEQTLSFDYLRNALYMKEISADIYDVSKGTEEKTEIQ